jgi:replicative DNA helicase
VKAENSLARIQRVSNTVRGVAVDHRVLTLALSQLKREASQDYTQTPTAQSLMGGSPLENDSMQIAIIDHSRRDPWYTPAGDGKQLQGWDSWLCWVKNRYGPTLDVPIRFDPRTMLITQRRKEESE